MQIWSGNQNMEAFHKMEKELIAKHHGKTAIFSDGRLVAIGKDEFCEMLGLHKGGSLGFCNSYWREIY